MDEEIENLLRYINTNFRNADTTSVKHLNSQGFDNELIRSAESLGYIRILHKFKTYRDRDTEYYSICELTRVGLNTVRNWKTEKITISKEQKQQPLHNPWINYVLLILVAVVAGVLLYFILPKNTPVNNIIANSSNSIMTSNQNGNNIVYQIANMTIINSATDSSKISSDCSGYYQPHFKEVGIPEREKFLWNNSTYVVGAKDRLIILPTNQEVYVKTQYFNETYFYAICNPSMTDCCIYNKYRHVEGSPICGIERLGSDWNTNIATADEIFYADPKNLTFSDCYFFSS